MDSVKSWVRSKSMSFHPQPGTFGSQPSDFKSQTYGPTDRAMKSAADICKKLTPSVETKTAVMNSVKDAAGSAKGYSRKFIPNENTKQKVSRFYESQVAKLKYSQLKDGFHPGSRSDDLEKFCEDDSYYGASDQSPRNYNGINHRDQEVPSFNALSEPMRARAQSLGTTSAPVNSQAWNGTFMQYKEPVRRPF